MESDEGTVTGNIGRSLRDRMKMAVFPDGESGKHAVTHYRVLERLGYVNLVECRLETGRTHQIRVHMEYIGHPLFNDERYGGDRILKGTTFSKYRQFVENCFRLMPVTACMPAASASSIRRPGRTYISRARCPTTCARSSNAGGTMSQDGKAPENSRAVRTGPRYPILPGVRSLAPAPRK